jgi:hypothetical protein
MLYIYVQKVQLPPQRLATQSKLKAELRATFTLVLHLVPTVLHLLQPLGLLALPVLNRISTLDARHGLSQPLRVATLGSWSAIDFSPASSSRLATESSCLSHRSALAPHTHTLHLAQAAKAPDGRSHRQDSTEAGNAEESVIGLFDEVLEVHTVESGNEHANRRAKCKNRELQVEQHKTVAVGVENGTNDFFGVLDRGHQVRADLHDFVREFVVRLENELDFFMVVFFAIRRLQQELDTVLPLRRGSPP